MIAEALLLYLHVEFLSASTDGPAYSRRRETLI